MMFVYLLVIALSFVNIWLGGTTALLEVLFIAFGYRYLSWLSLEIYRTN
jgi:hypothetical protein